MSTKAPVGWRFLLLASLSIATDFGCQSATAQIVLLSLTNSVWKYEQDRNLDETGWQSPNFVDDTWPLGPGLLGFEDNPEVHPPIQTMLFPPDLPAPGLPAPRTYYFRTQFLYQHADFARPVLVFSNRLDDGAVFYLNGQEVKRIRIPDGAVTYVTQATNVPPSGDATEWDVFELDNPTLNWSPQPNVLAVEVHQRGMSADIVFGCELYLEYVPILWPTPVSQVVTQCNLATISVRGFDQVQPAVQWFQNGTPIDLSLNPTATNTTLIITNMQQRHAGEYYLTMRYGRHLITSDRAFVSLAVPPVDWQGAVRITNTPAGLRVDWDGCGTLEHSTNLVYWSDVPANPASPYEIPPSLDSLFYRIRR
jgi:hypothetical protein